MACFGASFVPHKYAEVSPFLVFRHLANGSVVLTVQGSDCWRAIAESQVADNAGEAREGREGGMGGRPIVSGLSGPVAHSNG